MSERHRKAPEEFPPAVEGDTETGKEPDKSPTQNERERLLALARAEWHEFGKTHEGTINAYFGTPDVPFTMEPGGWYVQLEGKIRVNADPSFFLEKGYGESEALFATFHEAEHFRDMIQDPEAFRRLATRTRSRTDVHKAYPKSLFRFYNCLEDVMVNRVVMKRWKGGESAKNALYPKLFASNDFRGQPRHRQLMYTLLREAMMPGEPCAIDPEVRAAVDAWQARGGSHKTLDVITAVDPRGVAKMPAMKRYGTIAATLEPMFEEMFKHDLEHWKPPEDKKGKGEKGEGGENSDDPFGDDPNEDAIPDPIDFDKAIDQAEKINKEISKRKGDEFKELMGVEKKDFEAYQTDYRLVEDGVLGLSHVFDKVIERRKSYRRALRKRVKEGPMLDPRHTATAVAEIASGHLDPTVFLDYEHKEVIRRRPSRIEFTLVADGSGSMGERNKDAMQRRFAILFMEALASFRDRIQKARRKGEKIQLKVLSEVRVFSDQDEVVKPLNESLTHAERVKMHRRLKNLPGGGNNEPATFSAIEREQFNQATIRDLHNGDLKKVVLFLSDGESDPGTIQGWIQRFASMAKVPGTDVNNLVVGCIGFEGGQSAVTTYAPNGYYAEDMKAVERIFLDLIENILEDV